ncbi:MAG TPA: hypothetical protein VLG12_07690 [Candidatus Saccharimonadales bacterium]|nr:hypothetical protein [Candidatus Saccharimonadales bacterium]
MSNKEQTSLDSLLEAASPLTSDLNNLREKRIVGYLTLEVLDLPRARSRFLSINDFLKNEEACLSYIDSINVKVILEPKISSLPRLTPSSMKSGEVKPYVFSNIKKEQINEYTLLLFQEFYKTCYSGSFLIEPDGRVNLDMIKGKHGDLSSGRKTPELTATREPYTIRPLLFNFMDPECCTIREFHEMKSFSLDAFRVIPADGSFDTSSVQSFQKIPSYTEFFVAQEQERSPLKVFFLDARLNPGYSSINIEALLERISDQSELHEKQPFLYSSNKAA